MTTHPRMIIVTGASRGIGLAITERLLQDGFNVAAVSRSPTAELDELRRSAQGVLTHYAFDLIDLGAIPKLVKEIISDHGAVFGLVNNAAIGTDGLLATQHASEISSTLRVNLESPIVLSKYVLRQMLRQREGRIVNISSIVARTGFSGLAVYAASKAGIEGFTRSLAREAGRANITVNAVAPGFVETAMTVNLVDERLATIERRSPLGLARPSDVAGVVALLLGPDGARITGSVLTVDGGSTS